MARLESALPRLAELPLGGTAVGTGVNAPPEFAPAVIAELAAVTGLPLAEAANHFEAQGARDALAETSGQLRVLAGSLLKICGDLRWMGSGPRAGLAELMLPDLQPGSSIMPGKVNPVLPEAVRMVCAQVIGNDAAIAFGCASGEFELNVMMPMLARNLLESIRLLASSTRLLADRCVAGIEADRARGLEYAQSSTSIVTPLARVLGYEEAARIAKQSLAERKTIRQVVVDRGHLASGAVTEAQLAELLDVLRMSAIGRRRCGGGRHMARRRDSRRCGGEDRRGTADRVGRTAQPRSPGRERRGEDDRGQPSISQEAAWPRPTSPTAPTSRWRTASTRCAASTCRTRPSWKARPA